MRNVDRKVYLVLALAVALAANSTSVPGPGPVSRYANHTVKFKRNFANEIAINTGLRLFATATGRLPESADEFLDSPYMPVSKGTLINPYSGTSVQVLGSDPGVVTGGKGSPPEVSLDPGRLGNLSFTKDTDGGVRLIFYRDPEDGSGRMEVTESGFSRKELEQFVLASPRQGSDIPSNGQRVSKLTSSMDDRDKRAFSICQYIGTLMMSVTAYGFSLPTRWEDLQATGMPLDIANPYTGEPIKDVSRNSPSPGDFTYVGIFNTNVPSKFYTALPLCYDSHSAPIDPDWQKRVGHFLDLERDKNFFDVNRNLVEKVVLIH